MRIGFVNYSDSSGGAARATFTLAEGLRAKGNDLRLFVEDKTTDYPWVISAAKSATETRIRALIPSIDAIPSFFYQRVSGPQMSFNFLATNRRLLENLNLFNPDVVNLHWVGAGNVPIKMIKNIKSPLVISLYDMWPFTGGCHYDNFCGKFIQNCGECPLLSSQKKDLTSKVIYLKQRAYQGRNITFVSPSTEMTAQAKKSFLLKNESVVTIPHGIDFNRLKIVDRKLSRELLGIPKDKVYLLFGCTGGVKDDRKGFKYIVESLKILNDVLPKNAAILLFGTSNNPFSDDAFNIPVIPMGRIYDDATLSLLYSAADLTMMPSKQEALGLTSIESLACGTPVIGFDKTGITDIISHQITGYLSKAFEVDDFANGINWILSNIDSHKRGMLRDSVFHNFRLEKITQLYQALYEEIIENNKNKDE